MSSSTTLLDRARSRAPRAPFGVTRPFAGAGAGAVLGMTAAASGTPVLTAIAFVPAGVAVAHDVGDRRLTDRWVAAAGVLSLAALLADGTPARLAAMAVTVAVVAAVHCVSPSSLGFGDVKFAAALAPAVAATSDAPVATALAWLCLASGLGLATAFVTRRRNVPFGPALLLAAWLVTR